MALQTLTTTATAADGQATATQTNVSGDTNANSNLLGPNGPTPLVPAFLLSGLLVVGIVLLCWWKRFAARRVAGVRLAGGMFVLEGTGAGSGMQGGDGRKIKLGPRPNIWDIHLADEDLKEVKWLDMKPISACHIQSTRQTPPDPRASSRNGIKLPSRAGHVTHKEASGSAGHGPNRLESLLDNSLPPSILRVSVLISMPMPGAERMKDHSNLEEDSKDRAYNSDSRSAQSGSGLDDCNLVLGTANVYMIKNDR